MENLTDVDQFIDVARHNLLALEQNLKSLGYVFANPEGAVQLADASANGSLRTFERRFGQIPLLFRRWYETFRSVDFSQANSQLFGTKGDPVAGLGLNCSLIFLDLERCLELSEQFEGFPEGYPERSGQTLIPIGGWASNCDPTGVWVPDEVIDPFLYNDGGGPISMSKKLSRSFEGAGFPFWDGMFRRRRGSRPVLSPLRVTPDWDAIRPILVQDFQSALPAFRAVE